MHLHKLLEDYLRREPFIGLSAKLFWAGSPRSAGPQCPTPSSFKSRPIPQPPETLPCSAAPLLPPPPAPSHRSAAARFPQIRHRSQIPLPPQASAASLPLPQPFPSPVRLGGPPASPPLPPPFAPHRQ
jgi:Wiskott-Aldrich syndrome protein